MNDERKEGQSLHDEEPISAVDDVDFHVSERFTNCSIID